MNVFVNEVTRNRLNRTAEALTANNFEVYIVKDRAEAGKKVRELLKEGDVIGVGGSETLNECGVLDIVREERYRFIDRYEKGLSPDEIRA
ncbi:MAG: LUD domain-containing protein, partial [Ruminiclostridium sp.]|nr:LUD domain-containing protein [Ruminiclostridium sp.]